MDSSQFASIFDALTPRQRQVLKLFLQGDGDSAIATTLHLDPSTVRRHLSNICKHFNLTNSTGEHYSYRDELTLLFKQHKPDWVNRQLTGQQPTYSEFPGGPLAIESPFYISRPPIETQCKNEVAKAGALIRIRAPRRMGKTSLLNRTLVHAQSLGYQAVRLNLGQAPTLSDLDEFLQWVCLTLSQKLGLPPALNDYWDDQFGSLISSTTYVQSLLQTLKTNLVLGIDEVDWLLQTPETARGFFALIRSWHEEANSLDSWQKLRLIVVHSTEVYIPLNLHQSPFNVGLPLRLPNLTVAQGLTLADKYGLKIEENQLQKIYTLVGGHPYLLQLAFYHLQHDDLEPDALLKTASTQAGIYSNHLRRLWQVLTTRPELAQALQQVINANTILEPTLAYQLESMGVIHLRGNESGVSCRLYQEYFNALL